MTAHTMFSQRMEFANVKVESLNEWKLKAQDRFRCAVIRLVQGSAQTQDRVWAAVHSKSNTEFGRYSEEDREGWVRTRIV